MKRCAYCGNPLGWPYVELTKREREVLIAIMNGEAKTHKEIAKIIGSSENTARTFRLRLNTKLNGKATILNKPIRLVKITEIHPEINPRYLST